VGIDSVGEFLGSAMRGIRSLVFPPSCALCGLEESEGCPECIESWRIAPAIRLIDSIPIFSPVIYDARARSVVLAAKERGERLSRTFIVEAISSVVEGIDPGAALALIPIPTSKRALRKRGDDFLARVVDEVVSREPKRLQRLSLLDFKYQIHDQSGLSIQSRERNLNGSLEITEQKGQNLADLPSLVIIDDVLTSGSTMRAAIRALRVNPLLRTIAGVSACRSDRF
jgi:predicted amidophosphoribosyltransferase